MLISDWSSDVCSSDLAMNDQDDPRGPNPEGPNPLIRNLLIWGGVFMALLLAVSMFSSAAQAPGSQIAYSDFRDKVAEGSVAAVSIAEERIVGTPKHKEDFSTKPVASTASLPEGTKRD